MADRDMIDFGIWRRMEEGVTAEVTKREAPKASQRAITELRNEDVEVERARTDVLEDSDGDTGCAYCHYRAPSEEAIREHSERAGLPVTELTRMDDQLDREVLE